MNNEQLLRNLIKVKNNLTTVKKELKNAECVLNQSITFNNIGFKSGVISDLNNKINVQINNINRKLNDV